MRKKAKYRDMRDADDTTSYTIHLPTDLYEDMRHFTYVNKMSIAYLMQTSIEEFLEREQD